MLTSTIFCQVSIRRVWEHTPGFWTPLFGSAMGTNTLQTILSKLYEVRADPWDPGIHEADTIHEKEQPTG